MVEQGFLRHGYNWAGDGFIIILTTFSTFTLSLVHLFHRSGRNVKQCIQLCVSGLRDLLF